MNTEKHRFRLSVARFVIRIAKCDVVVRPSWLLSMAVKSTDWKPAPQSRPLAPDEPKQVFRL